MKRSDQRWFMRNQIARLEVTENGVSAINLCTGCKRKKIVEQTALGKQKFCPPCDEKNFFKFVEKNKVEESDEEGF